jgi:hypothetical protein
MRWKIVCYVFGTVILAASIAMYANVAFWQRTHHLTPLEVPLSLAPGAVTTVRVPVDTTRKYDIVIDAETRHFQVQTAPPDVSWQLSDRGTVIAEGSSINQSVQSWGGTLEQSLGTFEGQAGHDYMLVATAKSNTIGVAGANPVLKVQIPRGYWEGHLVGIAIQEVESSVVGLAGLLILGATFTISKIIGRRHNSGIQASTVG